MHLEDSEQARDERDAGFSTCSDARFFAPAYGKGSALASRYAGIGGNAIRAGESIGSLSALPLR